MFVRLCLCLLVLVTPASAGAASLQVFAAEYFADTQFPQFGYLWRTASPFAAEDDPSLLQPQALKLGGYAYVHFQNTGAQPATVTDLGVGGIRLSEGLGKSNDRITGGNIPGSSIYLSKLPRPQIDALASAGEPVWWKCEPETVAPGATGQIVLRLRREPGLPRLMLSLFTGQEAVTAHVEVKANPARFAQITFTPDLKTVNLYVRHPSAKGVKPDRVFMDGRNVTALCAIAADPAIDIAPILLKLSEPLPGMSFHSFRVGFSDGVTATAGIRAWGSEMAYGMWGGLKDPREFLPDWARHNINVQMGHANKDTMELSLTDDGEALMKSLGMRSMATWQGNARKPLFYFLLDEPDAHDGEIDEMEKLQPLGCLGQGLVERMSTLRAKDASVPQLLNIDNTYTPENWYMYHQLADIPSIDPYYQAELDGAYSRHPGRFPSYTRPTYVYAATKISASSAAPKPLHVILCSTRYTDRTGYKGRFPTPEEKRLEVYYALAAGAKGLLYWWFSPEGECNGVADADPTAKALYKEIGLIGAEVRTAGPLITTACPASVPVKTASVIAARSLLCGLDTVVVVAMNEDVLSDRVGSVVKAFPHTAITVTPPSWMQVKDAFQITHMGTGDVPWKADAGKIVVDPTDFREGRLIVLTADQGLRGRLQTLYQGKFAANVQELTGTGH